MALLKEEERLHAAPLRILFTSLVFLALCRLLWVVVWIEPIAAVLWLRVVLLLSLHTVTLV